MAYGIIKLNNNILEYWATRKISVINNYITTERFAGPWLKFYGQMLREWYTSLLLSISLNYSSGCSSQQLASTVIIGKQPRICNTVHQFLNHK